MSSPILMAEKKLLVRWLSGAAQVIKQAGAPMSDDMVKYPRLTDLERKARRRIPHFIFEYLDAGTGRDFAKDANEAAYRELNPPQFLRPHSAGYQHHSSRPYLWRAVRGCAGRPVIQHLAGRRADTARAAKAHGFPML